MWIDAVDRRRSSRKSSQGRWNVAGAEGRRFNDKKLFIRSIQAIRLQDQILWDPVIKDAKTGPQYRFGSRSTLADAPGDSNARRKIGMVVDVGLRLIPQSITQGKIRPELPVVFGIKTDIDISIGYQ